MALTNCLSWANSLVCIAPCEIVRFVGAPGEVRAQGLLAGRQSRRRHQPGHHRVQPLLGVRVAAALNLAPTAVPPCAVAPAVQADAEPEPPLVPPANEKLAAARHWLRAMRELSHSVSL
ncbi:MULTISPECIES: hypothetical protein [Alphaproteobacteria]|uniref:hypothetical protein n=1 Tax=Alphaproteobacteria TaxID=28211 RepID=UPI0011ED9629|nr:MULTISPECIES: hypothetical protein [Rhodospirillales]